MFLDPSDEHSTKLHLRATPVAEMSIEDMSKLLQNVEMREALLISETRLKNLTYLAAKSDILQKEFAKSVATDPNVLNQYLRRVRKIGDRMARKVEAKLALGLGWMDQPHPEEWELGSTMYDGRARSRAASRTALTMALRMESLPERAQELILGMIESFEEKQPGGDGDSARVYKPKPD